MHGALLGSCRLRIRYTGWRSRWLVVSGRWLVGNALLGKSWEVRTIPSQIKIFSVPSAHSLRINKLHSHPQPSGWGSPQNSRNGLKPRLALYLKVQQSQPRLTSQRFILKSLGRPQYIPYFCLLWFQLRLSAEPVIPVEN